MTLKQAVQTLNEEYYQTQKGLKLPFHTTGWNMSPNGSVAIRGRMCWWCSLQTHGGGRARPAGRSWMMQLEQLQDCSQRISHQISHSTRTVEHEEEIITRTRTATKVNGMGDYVRKRQWRSKCRTKPLRGDGERHMASP